LVYENKCGPFTLKVSDPHPMWVTIQHEQWGKGQEIDGARIEQLRDLKHLIDRAIAAAEERERKHGDAIVI
jgi:hypothetical protein